MSGFCACETEGFPYLCNAEGDYAKGDPQCSWYCKNYEQGKLAPMYPVPAISIRVWFDEEYVAIYVRGPDTKDGYRVYPSIVYQIRGLDDA